MRVMSRKVICEVRAITEAEKEDEGIESELDWKMLYDNLLPQGRWVTAIPLWHISIPGSRSYRIAHVVCCKKHVRHSGLSGKEGMRVAFFPTQLNNCFLLHIALFCSPQETMWSPIQFCSAFLYYAPSHSTQQYILLHIALLRSPQETMWSPIQFCSAFPYNALSQIVAARTFDCISVSANSQHIPPSERSPPRNDYTFGSLIRSSLLSTFVAACNISGPISSRLYKVTPLHVQQYWEFKVHDGLAH